MKFQRCSIFFALLVGMVWAQAAKASGDYECAPNYTLTRGVYTGCNNAAALSPGNDTIANLLLLMLDARRAEAVMPAIEETKTQDTVLFGMGDLAFHLDRNFKRRTDETYADTGEELGRCQSNSSGGAAFISAIENAALPEAEREALINLRRELLNTCATSLTTWPEKINAVSNQIHTPPGQDFITYLSGAAAFYGMDSRYDIAHEKFAALEKSDSPWLRETALYMLARLSVNGLQVGSTDEYGNFKENWQANVTDVDDTLKTLDGYLAAYPQGAYADSARGLKRRVYWLGGMTDKLAAEYAALMSRDTSLPRMSDAALASEIDNKLFGFGRDYSDPAKRLRQLAITDPGLLAVIDLCLMRPPDDPRGSAKQPAISREELEAQRPRFAGREDLFDFLLASYAFYVGKKPAEVLRLIPDAARQSSYSHLEFSRQMLRGMALEALKDRNARGFWLQLASGAQRPLQHGQVELALAWHDERNNAPEKTFAPDSLVRNATLRGILVDNSASPKLLRQLATGDALSEDERRRALYVLLYKSVSRGRYAEFAQDVALVPEDARVAPPSPQPPEDWNNAALRKEYYQALDLYSKTLVAPLWIFSDNGKTGDYNCPAIRETATKLAQNSGDVTARLCLADFMRVNDFDSYYGAIPPAKNELGGAPSKFPGKILSRLEIYKSVIADKRASKDDKAYALYRAVMCYAPGGTNSCGGKDVPMTQRKAWFQTLKRDYADSRWARELKYYW
ncbi:MAG: hypothetical protein LBV44_10160 [Methylobacillus sp.]|nr:hypothetical protein [Methylobacillus sp.]